jgi:hypothetical protein
MKQKLKGIVSKGPVDDLNPGYLTVLFVLASKSDG